jgi:hypothetical protein
MKENAWKVFEEFSKRLFDGSWEAITLYSKRYV